MFFTNEMTFLRVGAVFAAASVVLAFPELLPASIRYNVAIATALLTTALSVALLYRTESKWPAVALLSLAVAVSVAIYPPTQPVELRHVTNLCMGVGLMAFLARAIRSDSSLVFAGVTFSFGAAVVLAVGVLGASISAAKLLLGAGPMVSQPSFDWLPTIAWNLPGLDRSGGYVNSNALGGAALLVLPTCVCAVLATFRQRSHWLLKAGAGLGVSVSLAALALSRSRMALLGLLVLAAVFGLLSSRYRKAVFASIGVAVVLAAGAFLYTGYVAPDNRTQGIAMAWESVSARVAIWTEAARAIGDSPLFGIGVSRFHEVLLPTGEVSRVSHAHNIFMQVALDLGALGLVAYLALFGGVAVDAVRAARQGGTSGAIAGGAGLSILAVHWFGLADAIALGSKVGMFQWFAAGLILASRSVQHNNSAARGPTE